MTGASASAAAPRPEPDVQPFFRFQSRRSVVHSTRGIVACTNPLAAQAGLKILADGGNAADAAVAVSAVLAVVDPAMTGIGGDAFALYFDAAAGTVRGLNASGRSPAAATREMVAAAAGVPVDGRTGRIVDEALAAATAIATASPHAVTVPAGAAGWVDLVEQFGSGALTLAQILAPAIRLADDGFPVSQLAAYYWRIQEDKLRTRSAGGGGAGCALLRQEQGGRLRAPHEGEVFRIPDLAATLRSLATHGKAGFYEGPVAEAIVSAAQAAGSLLSLEDLQHHARLAPDICEALSIPLGSLATESAGTSLRLWEHPPNGQGVVALLAMGLLGEMERSGAIPLLSTMEHNSAAYLHAVISALRIAFADASWFVADPEAETETETEEGRHHHHRWDARRLLDPAYLAQRAALYDPARALGNALARGDPPPVDGEPVVLEDVPREGGGGGGGSDGPGDTSDTVYVAVTDTAGNGCSFVNSVADAFGSGIVPPGTGFVLPNRGHMFRLGPANHPNVFAGGKRAYNTIIPAVVTAEGKGEEEEEVDDDDKARGGTAQRRSLHTVLGVMGGFMQPQGHVQVLLNMQAFGMDPQTALDAPRVCVSTAGFWTPERRVPSATGSDGDGDGDGDGDDAARRTKAAAAAGSVYVEEGVPDETVRGLQALGHAVVLVRGYGRSLFGRGQVIRAEHDAGSGERVYAAGSDGRGDGHAVPL